VGTAVVEVTEVPHRGCGKFSRRLGVDNLKFVNSQAGRELNLRAANAPIVSDGVAAWLPDRGYEICKPEIARAMTRRWISEVPSKIV
jgi:hypothetical protein